MLVSALDDLRRIHARAIDLAFAHIAGLDHVAQHLVGAGARGGKVDVGSVARGRLEHAGQHRGLGEVHVADGLAEIILCRGLDAVGAAAEVGAVEIELEDLRLSVVVLEVDSDKGLFDLAAQRTLGRQKHVLGELLGERATTLDHRVMAGVGG